MFELVILWGLSNIVTLPAALVLLILNYPCRDATEFALEAGFDPPADEDESGCYPPSSATFTLNSAVL